MQSFCKTFALSLDNPNLIQLNHYIVYFITGDLDPRAQCQGQSQSELLDHLEATSLTRGEGTVICTRDKIVCTMYTLVLDACFFLVLLLVLGAWCLVLGVIICNLLNLSFPVQLVL